MDKAVESVLGAPDYYSLFAVSRDSIDGEELRRSYRKLALLVHPDKNSGVNAEKAFKKLTRAYQVLTDPNLRRVYDTFGGNDDDESSSVENVVSEAMAMFPGMELGMATRLIAMVHGYTEEGPSRVNKMTVDDIDVFLNSKKDFTPNPFSLLFVSSIIIWASGLKMDWNEEMEILQKGNRLEAMRLMFHNKAMHVPKDEVLFCETFKKTISISRKKLMLSRSMERHEESIGNERTSLLCKSLREKQEELVKKYCWDTIELITTHYDSSLLLKKLKADCFRYLAEMHVASAAESATAIYREALVIAEEELPARDMLRLGIALNWSVFLHDALNIPDEACIVARGAFESATRAGSVGTGGEMELIQLLRNNLVRWTSTT